MRRTFLMPLIVAVVVLTVSPASWAWIDTGHKIIAMIAWEEMTPQTRDAVSKLLRQHPRYDKDLLANAPPDPTPEQLAMHIFAAASTWPDMVRSQSNSMHNAFNHPTWHYIDIPFEDGAKAPTAAEIEAKKNSRASSNRNATTRGAKDDEPDNVVEALQFCATELKAQATPPEKKAVDICWLAHLVGDIHQPLHAVTRYSKELPYGDAGGNYDYVLRDPPFQDSRTKLHLLWDSVAGDYKSEFLDHYVAAGVRADPQFSRAKMKSLLDATDFSAWANESHALGVQYVYLNGKLQMAISAKNGAATQPTPGVPPTYVPNAERVALQRVALAGYRLGDLMNGMFEGK